MIEERYELALDRIRLMQTEDTVKEPYRDYFKKMAEFVLCLLYTSDAADEQLYV